MYILELKKLHQTALRNRILRYFMNIALIAHDAKKELLVQFCIAYCGIMSRHDLCATGTTGKLVHDATGLNINCFLSGSQGGGQQVASRIACNEIDLLIFFRDPLSPKPHEPNDTSRYKGYSDEIHDLEETRAAMNGSVTDTRFDGGGLTGTIGVDEDASMSGVKTGQDAANATQTVNYTVPTNTTGPLWFYCAQTTYVLFYHMPCIMTVILTYAFTLLQPRRALSEGHGLRHQPDCEQDIQHLPADG